MLHSPLSSRASSSTLVLIYLPLPPSQHKPCQSSNLFTTAKKLTIASPNSWQFYCNEFRLAWKLNSRTRGLSWPSLLSINSRGKPGPKAYSLDNRQGLRQFRFFSSSYCSRLSGVQLCIYLDSIQLVERQRWHRVFI